MNVAINDASTARAELKRLIESGPSSYAALSRMLGRNPSYLQQYVKRGSPQLLEERDLHLLARFFGVDESRLGGRNDAADSKIISVPVLDVAASAGPGATVGLERVVHAYAFDSRWLRGIEHGSPDRLSIVRVRGDSMTPTLIEGDEILVSVYDGTTPLRDGIYVLDWDGTLLVKRIAINPSTGRLTVASDNAAYPTWSDCAPDSLRIIGRVVWSGRKFG